MELRHLRYFVAVAEELGFARAAGRLHVAQPALSKQIRDLEAELGVALFERLPRGVRLTRAGEAFLTEARNTLDGAVRAIATARGASESRATTLHFAHGELSLYAATIEPLLATFRVAHPEVQVRVSSQTDGESYRALRERTVLPASHPLAAKSAVRLAELQTLPWLHSATQRWPGFPQAFEEALQDRGLLPQRRLERPKDAPSHNLLIAAGEAWALTSEALAAPYRTGSQAIVYRPFVEPPIPCWLALVWLQDAAGPVQSLIDVARCAGLAVGEAAGAARPAGTGEALDRRPQPTPTTRAIAARRRSPKARTR